MIDPPRPEAISCACLSVSGYSGEDDHALTAGAIARMMGLNQTDEVWPSLDRN